MVIDTLKTVRRLKEAGFSEEQAEILTEIIFDGPSNAAKPHRTSVNGNGDFATPYVNGHGVDRDFLSMPGSPPASGYNGASKSERPGPTDYRANGQCADFSAPQDRLFGSPQPYQGADQTSADTRLVKWVVPLILAQGVLIWGVAQFF